MWIVVISVCCCISLVMSLGFCLCWKKKRPKDDWLGIDGLVTQKNPDENVNHLPCISDATDGANDPLNKRTFATNTRRSLPDIPLEQENVNWEPTGDNSSEHYATVGQYQNLSAKRHTLPNGIEPRPSISQHSSLSQADDSFSPYERVKYDKINSTEHPYAQVQPSSSRIKSAVPDQIPEERSSHVSREETNSVSNVSPTLRQVSAQSSGTLDIPASVAVAGGIAASPELPYMTPPIQQSNFSGDSQDSSKGYTSISVREPLANIIAQTKGLNKKRELDPHYSTVSDDSDDVYTTIPDANNQIYTSESETYARIPSAPITVEAEVNPIPHRPDSPAEIPDELYEPAPQPLLSNVDILKHVTTQQHTAHTHSRQASTSSSINVGSPKPEKRQANSPLPPPPTTGGGLLSSDGSTEKLPACRNLDDLYAKVYKNKRKDSSEDEKSVEKHPGQKSSNASVNEDEAMSDEPKRFPREHDYETLRKSPRKCSDPDYEQIRLEAEYEAPGYERLQTRGGGEPGYESIDTGPDSICDSDPNYEVLKQAPPSDIDPNYEQLKHKRSNASDMSSSAGYAKINELHRNTLDVYSVINKKRKSGGENSRRSNSSDSRSTDDPNYESVFLSESNYVTNGNDTDPSYESVSRNDPNYESVKFAYDPPYEKLDDSDLSSDYERVGSRGSRGRGYETIDSSESSNGGGGNTNSSRTDTNKSEPPYERLDPDTDTEIPGYERIKKVVGAAKHSSTESSSSVKSSDTSGTNNVGNSRAVPIEATSGLLDENGIIQV